MATTIFPNFNPTHDGKDGQSRALYQDPPTLEFPNMDATITGKDGEDYNESVAKAIYSVIKIFNRVVSGVKEVNSIIRTQDGIKSVIAGFVCVLSKKSPSTLEFPNMDATITGKDGGDITQEQAETQSTYTNNGWDFVDIWYMGSKYPLLM